MDPMSGLTPNATRWVGGGYNMIKNWLSNHPDPKVWEDYQKGRDDFVEWQKDNFTREPLAYILGGFAGAAVGPKFGGIAPAAKWGERAWQGVRAGGLGGGAYGANQAISEGKSPLEVLAATGEGAALGAGIGGPLNAIVGPRGVNPASPGRRAAEFADTELKAPIPLGLASDNPLVNAPTAAVRATPWFGARMSGLLDKTQESAGEFVSNIAGGMRGAAADRAGANVAVRPGLQAVIDDNKNTMDAAYDAVRNQIDTNAGFPMPQTQAALAKIKADRAGRGKPNPSAGLEQFENVSGKNSTFADAHGARQDARPSNPDELHPGINGKEYNDLTRAMTQDIRGIVASSAAHKALASGQSQMQARIAARGALRDFTEAERAFGPLKEQNQLLQGIVDAKGESGIATLLNASREKGGNLQLLSQLKAKMPPQQFQVIGGQLLHELGATNQPGGFSLNQFVTNWNKVSDGAKGVLFDPQQRANIDKVFNLGTQLKGSMRDVNTSHTSNTIILFDLARDAALLGIGVGTGAVSVGATAGGAALGVPAVLFAHWVSSPAKVASMAAWSSAYQAALGSPTPARMAVFSSATRNLSHNLGIPPDRIMQIVHAHVSPQNDQSGGLQQ